MHFFKGKPGFGEGIGKSAQLRSDKTTRLGHRDDDDYDDEEDLSRRPSVFKPKMKTPQELVIWSMVFEIIFNPGWFGFYLPFDADYCVFELFHRDPYFEYG